MRRTEFPSERGPLAVETGSHVSLDVELFVITQHGLMYAAGLNAPRRALYYLATPPALFDPFVDQVDTAELREGTVVAVDSRFGRDLASAHPMDAALRRILDEHLALRVNLPA
jgi:glucose-6-phosphate 1-dehydrogenase